MYISFARPIVYSSLVYSSPIKPIASAVRLDCVRCPIRLRPPYDGICRAKADTERLIMAGCMIMAGCVGMAGMPYPPMYHQNQ